MGASKLTRRATLFAAAGFAAVPGGAGTAYALSVRPDNGGAAVTSSSARRTPFDYGADTKAGPEVNQQKAVQAMLDDCAASWNPSSVRFARIPDLADRAWNVGEGVSIPNLRQPGFALANGTLLGSGKDSTVLDLAGCNSIHLHNLFVFGDRRDPPKVGILTSRTQEAGNFGIAPNLEWFNVRTWGSFSGAAVVSIANEVTSFLQCSIENDSKNPAAFAYMNVQNSKAVFDRIGPVTSVSTLPKPGRRFSNIIHSFDQVRMKRPARFNADIADISRTNPAVVRLRVPERMAHGDLRNGDKVWFYRLEGEGGYAGLRYTIQTAVNVDRIAGTFELADYDNRAGPAFVSGSVQNQTGPAMLFSGSHDVHISNGYALTYGNHSVVFDLVNGGAPRSFRMHMQCEHSPRAPIMIDHGDKPKVWQGAVIHLANSSQVNADCIVDDNGAGTLLLHDVKLKVNNMGHPPAAKVFRNPGRFALRDCEITVPMAAALNDAIDFQEAGAVFEAYDRRDARHDWRPTEFFRLKYQGEQVATVVAAASIDLDKRSSPVNAVNKYAGKMVFNTTLGQPVYATGGDSGSQWNDAMGQTLHKPV